MTARLRRIKADNYRTYGANLRDATPGPHVSLLARSGRYGKRQGGIDD